jgi:hypothetical protein
VILDRSLDHRRIDYALTLDSAGLDAFIARAQAELDPTDFVYFIGTLSRAGILEQR